MKIRKKWSRFGGYGALWLTGAVFATKLIGVLQKIPLQNLAGDEVYGMYNTVYPIYQLMMAIAIAGIPTALSYYIVQQSNREVQERILRTGLILISGASVISSLIMYICAPIIAQFIGDLRVLGAIQVLAVALIFTPVIAVYRGYYQGVEQAKTSSISQLIEQVIRVLCMIVILLFGLKADWDNTTLAAAVMWGSALGAIVALVWFVQQRKKQKLELKQSAKLLWLDDLPSLIKIALPASLAAIVVPMMSVVDAFTIPKYLIFSGFPKEYAMAQFGIYNRIQPLIQLVSMLLGALAAGLIPSWVKTAKTFGGSEHLHQQLSLLHRIAIMIGIGASVGLIILAKPINVMLYKDAVELQTFILLSITALASCVLAIQAPAMQAAGLTRLPYLLLLAAAITKGIGNTVLVPRYGIEGAAISGIIALYVSSIIGSVSLYLATKPYKNEQMYGMKRMIKRIRPLLVTILASVLMLLSIELVHTLMEKLFTSVLTERLLATCITLVGVILGGLVFILIMIVFRGFTKADRELMFRKL